MFVLIVALFFSLSLTGTPFETLDALQKYAKNNPEIIKPSNNDWLNPDFNSFYKKVTSSWWQRLFSRVSGSQDFDIKEFENLLKIYASRPVADIDSKYLAERIEPSSGDIFVIWGDLAGAFHSLVRDLTYLHQQGILDADLKIVKKNYYLVFNGNAIEGSPYSLETLTALIQLMIKNPEQVIYTRGYSEEQERWQNFEMMRQLKIKASFQSKISVPFNDLLNHFFNSLPVALIVTKKIGPLMNAVVITGTEDADAKFQSDNLGGLYSIPGAHGFFAYNKPLVDGDRKVTIRAIIGAEDRSVSYQKTEGLLLAGIVGSAVNWYVFSGPSLKNQNLYRFKYDAFVQLVITDGIESWSLELINRLVDDSQNFKQTVSYLVTSGRKVGAEKRSDEQELVLGATMDLSKSASSIGRKVSEGLHFSFQKVRDNREVPGVFPQVRIVDDEYTPFKTKIAVDNFLKSGVDILIGSQGSASLDAYLDLVKDRKVLVLFPLTGAPEFRKPDLKYLIHFRGSYIQEGQELVRFALKELKSKKIAIFYQDDSFGRGALEGAIRALRAAGITDYLAVPHERNATEFKRQIEQITNFNPDTILFSTNSINIRALIHEMGVQYFAGKKLLGISVYEDAFERFLKDKGLKFIITRMVPDPATSTLEIAKEYRDLMDRNNLSYDKISFESFINASILFEVLRAIKRPITKEKIVQAVEGLKNYSFKGLVLDFNPETRSLSNLLWLDTGHGPWLAREASVFKKDDTIMRRDGSWQLGSALDLSGGIKELGKEAKSGLELRLQLATDMKLANLPQLTIVDDGYDPGKTRQVIEGFIKKGIDTVIACIGSPTLESYLDLIRLGDVTVLFPTTGTIIARDKELYNIVNLRSSYADEARVLARYATQELKAKKIVSFYQDDAFGKTLMDAGRAVLDRFKDITTLEVSYQRHQQDFSHQAKQILDFGPDTILCFSIAVATQELFRKIGVDKVVSYKLLGNSAMAEEDFLNFVRDVGLKFVYTNVFPNPQTSTLPIVTQYREYAKKNNAPIATYGLETFIAMDLLLYITQPMGTEISRDAIIKQLMNLKNQEYKGLTLSFDPETRTLLHSLWLDEGNPEWKMIPVIRN